MSTILEEPQVTNVSRATQRLRHATAAARLSFTWLGHP